MMQQTFIGVDVAKGWLDIHHPKQRSLRIDSVRRWKPRRCPSAASIPDKPATSPALWA
jgi:hypothetical protein